MTATKSDVIATLSDLIAINSINPAYEQGRPEAAVAEYVEQFFHRAGVETFRQPVLPERYNVIARLAGRNPRRRVVLEAHMDTVSIAGMTIEPFQPEHRDGCLFGRGSCDTKGGLAAMMHAVANIKRSGEIPPCEVWLAAVVDEEVSFQGVQELCKGLQADAAIVAEPTELRAIRTGKGVLRWDIRTRGRAAHSSKPHLGVNAISHMAQVIAALDTDSTKLAATAHPLLGPATLNVGVIRGGVQVNFVPDQCEIEVDRRLLPSETPEDVFAGYANLLEKLKLTIPSMDLKIDAPKIVDPAFETSEDSAVVNLAGQILNSMGLDGTPGGVPFGSDASKLARSGIPSIIFGPGSIDRAHAAVEYVECNQVQRAAEFYSEFILNFE